MKKIVGLAALVAALLLVRPAAAEQIEDVPDPLATSGRSVGDNAGVLGPAYVDLIDGISSRLKSATGAELAVITVRNLGGTTSEDFAERLFKRLGIGEKGKDNGLLLLFALDDRAVRFEVGYGLEAVIPDSRAGQLLDELAIPFLARGEHGRGLYAVSRAAAEAIAASSGVALGLTDPAVWPDQPKAAPAEASVKDPLASPQGPARQLRSPALPFILAGVLLGLTGLWIFRVIRRFDRVRSRADRLKASGAGVGFSVLIWAAAAIGWIVLLSGRRGAAVPLIFFAVTPGVSSVLVGAVRRAMRKRALDYKLPCPSCHAPMLLVPEDEDDAQLSTEESAEERAGGMDYELWNCPQCGTKEIFPVKLGKASPCPQCGRRTLVRNLQILVGATTAHGGRERISDECRNPKCGYAKSWERDTARIIPASSASSSGRSSFSSSSSSSSSRSSFGGGRSGGGGASRRF